MNSSSMTQRCLLPLALTVSAAVGCSSSAQLVYAPRAIEQGLDVLGRDGPVARAFVAVARVSTAARESGELLLRLRIENLSAHPLTLQPDRIELLGADLLDFGKPAIEPADDLTVEPGAGRTFELTFPYPEGFLPSSAPGEALNLRWELFWNGRPLAASTELRRRELPDDRGWWWPPSWFSVGVGVQL